MEIPVFDHRHIKDRLAMGERSFGQPFHYQEIWGDTFVKLLEERHDMDWVNYLNSSGAVILGNGIAGEFLKGIYNGCEFRFEGFTMLPLMETRFKKYRKMNEVKEKDFFCLTADRRDRPHRARFKTFLESNDLTKHGICRFQDREPDQIDYSDLSEVIPESEMRNLFKPAVPSVGLYNRTKYEIVIESYGFVPDDDSFTMTEKIFKPILMEHPFIVVGTKGYLRHMVDLGFKTFGNHIDESYDLESSETMRFQKIGENIKLMSRQRPKFFEDLRGICRHNYRHYCLLRRNELVGRQDEG